MKKLLLLMVLVALSITSRAKTFELGMFSYEVLTPFVSYDNPGTVACTGLSESGKQSSAFGTMMSSIVYCDGCPYLVTTIAEGAFQGVTNVGSLSLPYGLKTINANAFKDCTGLYNINIPSSVTIVAARAFSGCSKLTYVSWAMIAPTGISTSRYSFPSGNNCVLSIPRTADKSAVREWFPTTWFSNVVYSGQARDFTFSNGANVVVTKAATSSSDGEFTIVGFTDNISDNTKNGIFTISEAAIKPSTHYQTFRYVAVADSACAANSYIKTMDLSACTYLTRVGKYSFRNCGNLTSVALAADTIDERAFCDCANLTTATWGNNLSSLNASAFRGTSLSHDIILPVGLKNIGSSVFYGVSSKNILVPSTILNYNTGCFNGMSQLENMYVNFSIPTNSSTWYFDLVPTSCRVYVPVGKLAWFKAHKDWSRFTTIVEGAFDFAYNSNLNSMYKMTVTSTSAVTVNGVTYDGRAKYVYTPNMKGRTSCALSASEENTMVGDTRKYLMTEIGDSCFVGSKITVLNFSNMPSLSRIGKKAFYGTPLTSADLPANTITFGEGAFTNASSLTEIVTHSSISWNGQFFGNNASNFNLYVPNNLVYNTINSTLKNYDYDSNYKCSERVAPCFTATASTMPLAVQGNLDFSSSNLPRRPRYVTGFNASTGTATTTDGLYRALAGRAVMLTDLVVGTFYKIPRYYSEVTSSYTSLLVPNTSGSRKNIYTVSNAYYWDAENLKFVKPTSAQYIPSGEAYLVAEGGGNDIYLDLFPRASATGDVNGDGIIDITDVNMTINMVLGKVDKTTAGDINGDGTVDITDVNAVINLMLGK